MIEKNLLCLYCIYAERKCCVYRRCHFAFTEYQQPVNLKGQLGIFFF